MLSTLFFGTVLFSLLLGMCLFSDEIITTFDDANHQPSGGFYDTKRN